MVEGRATYHTELLGLIDDVITNAPNSIDTRYTPERDRAKGLHEAYLHERMAQGITDTLADQDYCDVAMITASQPRGLEALISLYGVGGIHTATAERKTREAFAVAAEFKIVEIQNEIGQAAAALYRNSLHEPEKSINESLMYRCSVLENEIHQVRKFQERVLDNSEDTAR